MEMREERETEGIQIDERYLLVLISLCKSLFPVIIETIQAYKKREIYSRTSSDSQSSFVSNPRIS